MSQRLLEICCYSALAADIAQKAGAHRIELCDNFFEGGTTPSPGNLHWAARHLTVPVFPIIRPRGGHFVYNPDEVDIMKKDILFCKNLGFQGVVLGFLNEKGMVDYGLTAEACEWAWPLEVTFHRAFDRVVDPFENLEIIKKAGCQRILTSGQTPNAIVGSNLIIQLVKQAGHDIIIMPGAGIRSQNLANIAKMTNAIEFHSSALMHQREPYFSPKEMEESISLPVPDENEIGQMLNILEQLDTAEN
jgi:copper homeostasis protein